jgi:hypothetical protein
VKKFILLVLLACIAVTPALAQGDLTLTPLGTFRHGGFDTGASEIAAFDPASNSVFVVNGETQTIDILDITDPANPTLRGQIDVTQVGASPNSVAVFNGIVAVAIESDPPQDPGFVAFYTTDGQLLNSVMVGALPDMLTFTPDGTKVLVANEGEPASDFSRDPDGSVSIIDISAGVEAPVITTLTGMTINPMVRSFGPSAGSTADFEPEYIAVTPDSTLAFVVYQENNAFATIDLVNLALGDIIPFGYKDHSLPGNELDAGTDDGVINIANWPVFGMYQPDGIAAYVVDGVPYLVTANEGDTRDYDAYSEEGELGETPVDENFPGLADLLTEEAILGLGIVTSIGDTDGDGDLDALYIPGGRSFSIWTADGTLVFDSGSDFERITAEMFPNDFNSTNDENGDFDGRSDNKGPEPEGLALGTIGDRTFAFIGLERIGGIMVYDITDPAAVQFVTYVNTRDFSGDPEAGTAGDLGPEGVLFISAADSPTGEDLLVVSYEISGTTTIFRVG